MIGVEKNLNYWVLELVRIRLFECENMKLFKNNSLKQV